MVKKLCNREIDNKDEYIKSLEAELKILSMKNEQSYTPEKEGLAILLEKQEEFLVQQFRDKEFLLSENKRLNQEVSRLVRTVSLNHQYIGFLANSFWWKLTLPMRVIYRKIKNKAPKYTFVSNNLLEENLRVIDQKVSILIFTYNAGEEFTMQLDNLNKQKQLRDFEIIVIDRGSQDHTIDYAKKHGATVMEMKDCNLTDSEIYEKLLPTINGEYIVLIDQNKIVDSKYWIYQAIIPLIDDMAISTVFFNQDVSDVKNSSPYQDLKSRMANIAGEQVLFFPKDRNMIQYFSPLILEKSSILVKKRISNLFLV